MPTKEPGPQFVDLPDVREVFASHIHQTNYDGHCVYVELGVARMTPTSSNTSDVKVYTAARLVLSPLAAAVLYQHLGKIIPTLEEEGVIKRLAPTSGATQ